MAIYQSLMMIESDFKEELKSSKFKPNRAEYTLIHP